MRESSPEEIAATESRRTEREKLRARQEFEKLGWSEWRLFSWIAYRDPSKPGATWALCGALTNGTAPALGIVSG